MKTRSVIVILIIILAIAIALIFNNPFSNNIERQVTTGTSKGDLAPSFTLQDINGNNVSLEDYKGKNIILNFWASWCPPCREEMPHFQQLHEQSEDDLVVIGVNLQESIEDQTTFLNELGINFPILQDPDRKVRSLYNVFTQPVTYFINSNGIIIDKKLGPLTIEEINEKTENLISRETIITQGEDEIMLTEDGTKYIINPDRLLSGGPGLGGIGESGGIPALAENNIRFETVKEANSWLPDEELGLGLVYDGVERFYPFRILVSHEIANDQINEQPILVTYCPLCFTGIAFKSEIDGQRERFGVSGKLLNSELVMYDETTKSYWAQTLGKAIIGPLTGTTLEKIPTDTVKWGAWKEVYPETKVLSRNTGFFGSYSGRNPYGEFGNFEDIQLQIGVRDKNPIIPDNTIVYGIEVDGIFKAYQKDDVDRENIVDTINGKEIVLKANEIGSVDVTVNGEPIIHETLFWFAWYAFHPETELFQF